MMRGAVRDDQIKLIRNPKTASTRKSAAVLDKFLNVQEIVERPSLKTIFPLLTPDDAALTLVHCHARRNTSVLT